MIDMKKSRNIGFDVLNKDKGAVVLKRVLPTTNRRRQAHAETFLPKLSVHYFEVRDVERLQSLAAEISERQRQAKNSTGYRRMLNILKLT
jgi:hypothetical protein